MIVCAVVLVFILFDILTGVIEAFYKKNVNSTAIRRGLYHKLSEVLALVGSYGLEYLIQYINLGVELPLLGVVAVYICLMELISIMENICDINPELGTLFKPYLEKLHVAVEDADVSRETQEAPQVEPDVSRETPGAVEISQPDEMCPALRDYLEKHKEDNA